MIDPLTDLSEGRANPPPRPRSKPAMGDLSQLNFSRGERIRVLKDNGRRGLVGLEGKVVQTIPGSVVVELDADPLLLVRANQLGGIARTLQTPRRHFRVTEVERVS